MEYSETLQMLTDLVHLMQLKDLIKVIEKCKNNITNDSQVHNLKIKCLYRYKIMTGKPYEN